MLAAPKGGAGAGAKAGAGATAGAGASSAAAVRAALSGRVERGWRLKAEGNAPSAMPCSQPRCTAWAASLTVSPILHPSSSCPLAAPPVRWQADASATAGASAGAGAEYGCGEGGHLLNTWYCQWLQASSVLQYQLHVWWQGRAGRAGGNLVST